MSLKLAINLDTTSIAKIIATQLKALINTKATSIDSKISNVLHQELQAIGLDSNFINSASIVCVYNLPDDTASTGCYKRKSNTIMLNMSKISSNYVELENTLAHELVHMLQASSKDMPIPAVTKLDDIANKPNVYYNMPTELPAWIQSITTEFSIPPIGPPTTADLVNTASLLRFLSRHETFNKRYIHWTNTNKERVLRVLLHRFKKLVRKTSAIHSNTNKLDAPFLDEPYDPSHVLAQWVHPHDMELKQGHFYWLRLLGKETPAIFEKDYAGYYWFYIGDTQLHAMDHLAKHNTDYRIKIGENDITYELLDTGSASLAIWKSKTNYYKHEKPNPKLIKGLIAYKPGTIMYVGTHNKTDKRIISRYVLYLGVYGGVPLGLSLVSTGRVDAHATYEDLQDIGREYLGVDILRLTGLHDVWKVLHTISNLVIVQIVDAPTEILRGGFTSVEKRHKNVQKL